ncbi:MAG: hypothetical protein KJ621_16460 [Proteobacteria bacterium]|nr:hypothetical protein [Pseudomonadota bacterium]
MTWDQIFKVVQTVVAGCLVAMIADYVCFRIKTAREMITRKDCAACKQAMKETDLRLFEKVDGVKADVTDIKASIGLILGRLGVRGGGT